MFEIALRKMHAYYSPTKILFGPDSAKATGEELRQLGGKKALIITDPGVIQTGLLQTVQKSLESAGVTFSIYDKVEPDPAARLVDEAAEEFRSEGCDQVIGVGGGSSLDVAKGVSVMATNEGSVLDVCGMDLVKKRGVPKVLIPTTAGTGSEVTRVFVITDEAENTKKVVSSSYTLADVAIVDPMLTLTMPPKVTAETGMDALVHAIETFVSMNATPFSHILAERAIEWIGQYLPIAWAKGSNLRARYHMSLASLVAGMAFTSGGLGAVHALAYPLGTSYHMPHGRSNAIMLPHVMRFNLPGSPTRYGTVAKLLGIETTGLPSIESAILGVNAVEGLLKRIQLPFHLCDYDIPKNDIPKLVEGAMRHSGLLATNPRDLSKEDVRSVYQKAYQ